MIEFFCTMLIFDFIDRLVAPIEREIDAETERGMEVPMLLKREVEKSTCRTNERISFRCTEAGDVKRKRI